MFKHIFKIVWNERKINFLLVAEYFLIFCILWFVGEYIYSTVKFTMEDVGMDIEHTYRVYMYPKDRFEEEQPEYAFDERAEFTATIVDRIKRYPGVEYVALSRDVAPYGGGWTDNRLIDTSDSTSLQFHSGFVTRDFFNVFRISVTGNLDGWDGATNVDRLVLSTTDGMFGEKPLGGVRKVVRQNRHGAVYGQDLEIKGYAPPIKLRSTQSYENIQYMPMPSGYFRIGRYDDNISIRVSPGADRNFAERFVRDMTEQLEVGDYYLADVVSYPEIAHDFNKRNGFYKELNGRLTIVGFLLLNIFLGILGSFWYRTQSRRPEIGLRMALGSSRVKVRRLMMLESMSLLTVAAIPAAVVSFLLRNTELVTDLLFDGNKGWRMKGVFDEVTRQTVWEMPKGIVAQDLINFAIAFGLLAMITAVAVWYPAKQASDVQPAETLHED